MNHNQENLRIRTNEQLPEVEENPLPVTPYQPGMTKTDFVIPTTETEERAVKYLSLLLPAKFKLTEKEAMLCLATGLFFSILIDLPSHGISSVAAEIITPLMIAIVPAFLITYLHKYHPGCFVAALRARKREQDSNSKCDQ